jgi:hypothetical protein
VLNVIIIVILLLVTAALIGGIVIAVLASRRAPDGFEDRDGFHVGRVPPTRGK